MRTAIPPTSTANVTGQHNKIGGITFGATPIIFDFTQQGIFLSYVSSYQTLEFLIANLMPKDLLLHISFFF